MLKCHVIYCAMLNYKKKIRCMQKVEIDKYTYIYIILKEMNFEQNFNKIFIIKLFTNWKIVSQNENP